MTERNTPRSGFTRADLLVLLGCVVFLGLVWLRPLSANSAARNDEAMCANNLRHIGQAFLLWWHEHEERPAWLIPPPSPSGTKSQPWHQNLWFQFFWISNELRSPRYLADPADDWPNLRMATSWGTEPGGLLNSAHKNNAVSYFLGLHATPLQPQAILSGDGNIRGGVGPASCSSGIPNTEVLPSNALWPENVHGNRGNVLFSDGRVEMTDTARLKEAVGWNPPPTPPGERFNWNAHFLKPRNP